MSINPKQEADTLRKLNAELEMVNRNLRAGINLINNNFPKSVLEDQLGEHYEDYIRLTNSK